MIHRQGLDGLESVYWQLHVKIECMIPLQGLGFLNLQLFAVQGIDPLRNKTLNAYGGSTNAIINFGV